MNKKKICFISLTNIYLTPYIKDYIQLANCDYDIIYWNRHNIEENINAINTYAFEYFMDENNNKFEKIKGYFKFKKFASNIVKKNSYDGIVLLQTSVGILLLMLLSNFYKKNILLIFEIIQWKRTRYFMKWKNTCSNMLIR